MGVGTDLMAGTVSGMSASLAGQPLDTVRVRLQSRGHLYAGTMDTVAKTFKADGARGFFRGAVPPLLGMGPKNAIGFGAHGAALRFLEGGGDRPTVELKRNASMGNVALAGCAAGVAQCAVVVPSDRIKCQLQVQTGGSTLSPGAVRDCLRTLIREDGLGVSPLVPTLNLISRDISERWFAVAAGDVSRLVAHILASDPLCPRLLWLLRSPEARLRRHYRQPQHNPHHNDVRWHRRRLRLRHLHKQSNPQLQPRNL